ncbi:hypothetical protein D1609_16740 [Leptospira borgpetersenii serovar Hardjo-bovis]|nr:hypothetical protein D1609_16740 [Leptospira borgpetersenii serovar Hardjo-bovis]TQE53628.1 hypothetical protein FFZ95_06510 [Leptospira borgpetersenii]TQE57530.1 hypothetical protein FFZ96_06375 [Leptospira borgpetersenii]
MFIYSASQNLRKQFLENDALSFLLYQKDRSIELTKASRFYCRSTGFLCCFSIGSFSGNGLHNRPGIGFY